MKKILISFLLVLGSTFMFADVFKNSDKMVEDFLAKGEYIKIIKNENNIYYILKNCVSSISVDEDDLEIATTGYSVWTGKNSDSFSFNISKYKIEVDEKGNFIITRK